jgi:outer membrane autotransporter protein
MTTNRTVTVPGGGPYSATFNGQDFGGRIEGGYHIEMAPLTLTPYAALQAQAFLAPAYGEHPVGAASSFALDYFSQSATDTRFELGAWADKMFAYPNGDALKLFGRLAWTHDWQSNPALTANFQTLPGATFVVTGAKPAADQALITVGAEWRLAKNWMAMAKVEGQFGGGTEIYAATGRITYSW